VGFNPPTSLSQQVRNRRRLTCQGVTGDSSMEALNHIDLTNV
jgi:hypothetical protein